MSPLVAATLVDVLPERLWSFGNLYRVFGRSLHFCVGGDGPIAQRTIELDGVEIGRGRKPFIDFHDAPGEKMSDLAWRVDLGWAALMAIAIVVAGVCGRVLRSSSRDIPERRAMGVDPSLRLQLRIAAAELSAAVNRSIHFVAFGLSVSGAESRVGGSVPGAQMQLKAGPRIPRHVVRADFKRWIIGGGLRDCVAALDAALEAARVEAFLWTRPGSVSRNADGTLRLEAQIAPDDWNWRLVAGRRPFNRLTLPEKMICLEREYGLRRPAFSREVLSINAARNCMTHRGGVVAAEDCDPDREYMTVCWRRLRMRPVGERREVRVGVTLKEPTQLRIDYVRRARRLAIGKRVSFSASEYVQVATTFLFYGNQLQESIRLLQEDRMNANGDAGRGQPPGDE